MQTTPIKNAENLHIAGYQFTALDDLEKWRDYFLARCEALSLKGTILLSGEGININLAGDENAIRVFQQALYENTFFASIRFHETYSDIKPYQRLKIKIKDEIITLRQPVVNAVQNKTPEVTPQQLKNWLDEKHDLTLLDTRNDYEVSYGTFENAVNLNLSDFNQFPEAVGLLPKSKPVVMFCTGGIRCEKAGLYLEAQGYTVYQLQGGILGYFKAVGGAHYQGECFVFDERVALDADLKAVK